MSALPIMILTIGLFTIGYRTYSDFLAAKVFALDAIRKTPAVTRRDGQNYYPMSKWVLSGIILPRSRARGP